MQGNYAKIMTWILQSEGGLCNDAHDPGGWTKYGIILADLPAGATPDDIKNLTVAQAMDIYARKYWNLILGVSLFTGMDYTIMDAAVNSGVGKGWKWLRQALKMPSSGRIDIEVIRTLNAVPASGRADLIRGVWDIRLSFLHALTTWQYFGKGWGTRCAQGRARSVSMWTTESSGPVVAHAEVTKDAAHAQANATKASKNAGASTTTGVTTASPVAAHHLGGLTLDTNFLLVLGGIALFLVGLGIFFWWKSGRHQQVANAALAVATDLHEQITAAVPTPVLAHT